MTHNSDKQPIDLGIWYLEKAYHVIYRVLSSCIALALVRPLK